VEGTHTLWNAVVHTVHSILESHRRAGLVWQVAITGLTSMKELEGKIATVLEYRQSKESTDALDLATCGSRE